MSPHPTDTHALLAAQRRSVRAYLPTPVPDAQLHALLASARRAPSGANLQPGHFTAVRGGARQRLSDALVQAWRSGHTEAEDYSYFPQPMPLALKRRQVASAQALYGALGVARDDRAGRDAQFERNFRFFDAPVALVVTLEHAFGPGGYMDLGMALYGLMLAAESQGLATCAVGALAAYPQQVRQQLGLDAHHTVVCGLALGLADPAAPVNQTRTSRCGLDEYFRVIE
ncbi:nitroreductase [Aquabacterium sp. A08]|uniref:nitroreductase n=1 Tax=Aquabacterium sp. A08 TaxID=2718532 RepID=UPI00352FFAC9